MYVAYNLAKKLKIYTRNLEPTHFGSGEIKSLTKTIYCIGKKSLPYALSRKNRFLRKGCEKGRKEFPNRFPICTAEGLV